MKKHTCIICSVIYSKPPSRINTKYCSRKCHYESRKEGEIKKCLNCKLEFYIYKSRIGSLYCSIRCKVDNGNVLRKCKQCLNTFKLTKSKSIQKRGYFCKNICYFKYLKINKSPFLGKKRPELSGLKHPNWKGGITFINHKIRTSIEYRDWRTAVFERDKYTCVWCGDDRGGNLNADHIKPFAFFPELRLDVSNGRTLCESCHIKTDTFGKRVYLYA